MKIRHSVLESPISTRLYRWAPFGNARSSSISHPIISSWPCNEDRYSKHYYRFHYATGYTIFQIMLWIEPGKTLRDAGEEAMPATKSNTRESSSSSSRHTDALQRRMDALGILCLTWSRNLTCIDTCLRYSLLVHSSFAVDVHHWASYLSDSLDLQISCQPSDPSSTREIHDCSLPRNFPSRPFPCHICTSAIPLSCENFISIRPHAAHRFPLLLSLPLTYRNHSASNLSFRVVMLVLL